MYFLPCKKGEWKGRCGKSSQEPRGLTNWVKQGDQVGRRAQRGGRQFEGTASVRDTATGRSATPLSSKMANKLSNSTQGTPPNLEDIESASY